MSELRPSITEPCLRRVVRFYLSFGSASIAFCVLFSASSAARLAASEKSDLNSENSACPTPVTNVSAMAVPPTSANVQES